MTIPKVLPFQLFVSILPLTAHIGLVVFLSFNVSILLRYLMGFLLNLGLNVVDVDGISFVASGLQPLFARR